MANLKVLLIGSGYMAEEYLKVLKVLNIDTLVLARNEAKAQKVAAKFGYAGLGGGVEALNAMQLSDFNLVIIAVALNALAEVCGVCLSRGAKQILLEKPGALAATGLEHIKNKLKPDVKIGVAYNRRFFNAVSQLKEKINVEGGALGCFFDFTDREKDILLQNRSGEEMEKWGWVNSTHVIDLAFYLIGMPTELVAKASGGWKEHPTGTTFVGSGQTKACLFSYFATWAGGGRWNVEISTKAGRYKLSPLEELTFCKKNQFAWEKIENPDDDDEKFKPGLFKMVKNALKGDFGQLPTIEEQIEFYKLAQRIFGYAK